MGAYGRTCSSIIVGFVFRPIAPYMQVELSELQANSSNLLRTCVDEAIAFHDSAGDAQLLDRRYGHFPTTGYLSVTRWCFTQDPTIGLRPRRRNPADGDIISHRNAWEAQPQNRAVSGPLAPNAYTRVDAAPNGQHFREITDYCESDALGCNSRHRVQRRSNTCNAPACTAPPPARRYRLACRSDMRVSFTPILARCSRATFSSRCLGSV